MALTSAKTTARPARPYVPGTEEGNVLLGLIVPALLCLFAGVAAHATDHRVCLNGWQAVVVAIEGVVQIETPKGWVLLEPGDALCHGDTIRTGPFSRATVRIPEGTLVRIDADSAIRVHAVENETQSWFDVVVKLIKGTLHAISRDPESLSFDTPFVNAGIEGTEFVLEVTEEGTAVTVLEGEVALENRYGTAGVPGGQRGFVPAGGGPTIEPVDTALRAVDWTRQYPPLLDRELPRGDQEPREDAERISPAFYTGRAASRLRAGAKDAAARDLEAALALEPTFAEAFALSALIALADGDKAHALELGSRAVELAPGEAAGWLALSHVSRAGFDLRAALSNAESAVRAEPRNAIAWARLAEARLEARDYGGARQAALESLSIAPDLGHAHAMIGFVDLVERGGAAAEKSFRKAIALQPSSWTARLGLALALYRQGDRRAARTEAEIALALDPTRATLRSHVGRIYDDENRTALGATLLDLAKLLDEDDSTGWFYDALRKQHENRLAEALLDFRRAYRNNGREGVYGSRLTLDEDLRARSAGIGRLHSALGFEHLAAVSGWRATIDDPNDYSAHRLLADVYAHRPRHHLARVNEVYQALLHQPLNVTPVQPQLSESSPFLLDVAGPSALAFQEYHSLLLDNGLSAQTSAVAAGNGTRGMDLAINGVHDRISYNVGVFSFETDGFRPNNDFEQHLFDAIVQARPNARTTYTVELRRNEIEKGDLALRFDPSSFSRLVREAETVDSVRFGLRRTTSGGTWLASVIAEQADEDIHGIFDTFSQRGTLEGAALDLQYITTIGSWNLVGGTRAQRQRQKDDALAGGPQPPVPATPTGAPTPSGVQDVSHASGYLYANFEATEALRFTFGSNLESVEGNGITRRRVNPKLGVMWDITDRTTLRAAAFDTLQPSVVSRHNIQPTLEPTHVMGFNQRYFGTLGEEARRFGLAIDHEFADNLFGGAEISHGDIETDIATFEPGSATFVLDRISRDERTSRLYLYWLPSARVSLSVTHDYERFDSPTTGPEGFDRLRTHRLPVAVNYFHPSGFTAGVKAMFVDQDGLFGSPINELERGSDRFWLADLALGLRLPSKRGEVSFRVHNLFDRQFRFQDTDPENPRIFPERLAQLRFTYSID